MTPNPLLDRLDKVTGGENRYTAICPAHDDKSPSLSITETPDKVLVHCHAGCTADEIVAAVGLELKDLFPESNLSAQQKQQYRKQKSRAEIEAALNHELLVLVQIVGTRVADRQLAKDTKFREQRPDWKPMVDEHWDRELLAAKRISKALGVLYVG